MAEIIRHKEIIPVKLDQKDKKLIYELDFHSRDPCSKLSKRVNLSKQGVEYKINNLIKKGVIKGFYPVINVPKLGFIYCRLLLTLQSATEKDKDKIINYLKEDKRVFWLFNMQGSFDLLAVIWSKKVSDFKVFVEDLETRFGNFIKRKVESIATDVVHYRYRFPLKVKKLEEIHIKETDERVEIDEKDKKVLDLLAKNPRSSLVDMSKIINESAKVLSYRIKKLENKKLIEAYRPVIDYNSLGYTYYKIFINLNKVSKEELTGLKDFIKYHPLVIYLIEGIGLPADIEIEMIVSSNQELFNFIRTLKEKFPKLIADYNTVVFMDTLKVRYLPF
ncbi:Lrp/AsnC family transcriptional regulator [Candidatus Pacearchaeota archaeon]|nr:Lrp/AsnC family transcriptional regulator [Candidatus Pacearchaeota archaeon]